MGFERDVCDQCGARNVRASSWWELPRRWFAYGGGMARTYECRSCGAAWSAGTSYAVLSRRSGWQRWLSLPGQVVAAVRRERTWEPVPRFYATVGAGAAAPAAVAALATRTRGRWWWPVVSAAAAISAAFALSATSAFRRGSAGRAIARVMAPDRAAAAELEHQAAAIRHSTIGLGVLIPAHWHGSLAFEGTQWSGRGRDQRLTGFSVVADDRDGPGGERRVEILHELGDVPLEDREQLQDAGQDDHVFIDGRRVPARHVAGPHSQAMVFEHDRRRIAVTATGVGLSGLDLTATRTIDPLLAEMIRRATPRPPS